MCGFERVVSLEAWGAQYGEMPARAYWKSRVCGVNLFAEMPSRWGIGGANVSGPTGYRAPTPTDPSNASGFKVWIS